MKQRTTQKLCGVVLIVCGILSAIINNDSTAAVLIIPLGVGILFTREQVVQFPTSKQDKDGDSKAA